MSDESLFRQRFLADSELFAGLSDDEIEHLALLVREREVEQGQVLMTEGSVGDSLFLLVSGRLEVSTRDDQGRDVLLADVTEPGSFLGEMSAIDPAPRSASVKAVQTSVVFEISAGRLEAFFDTCPGARVVFLRNVARVLARRLRDTNSRVAAGRVHGAFREEG